MDTIRDQLSSVLKNVKRNTNNAMDGAFPLQNVPEDFELRNRGMDATLVEFIIAKLKNAPSNLS